MSHAIDIEMHRDGPGGLETEEMTLKDRKSTRLNSSH